ncbi:hypothetical protein V8G54_025910 [Vigna mungo]|uniref:Uncharacterized protein n=1 Tax=Vigna mungo TaxID=3915 RepID=A0AAQ3N016_VIGMU
MASISANCPDCLTTPNRPLYIKRLGPKEPLVSIFLFFIHSKRMKAESILFSLPKLLIIVENTWSGKSLLSTRISSTSSTVFAVCSLKASALTSTLPSLSSLPPSLLLSPTPIFGSQSLSWT